MNKTVKYGLLITAANIIPFLLLLAAGSRWEALQWLAMVLLIELILAIIAAFTSDYKDIAAGLVFAFALTLLIGLGVCGMMANI